MVPITSSTNKECSRKAALLYLSKPGPGLVRAADLPKIFKVVPLWLFAAYLYHRIAYWYDILLQT